MDEKLHPDSTGGTKNVVRPPSITGTARLPHLAHLPSPTRPGPWWLFKLQKILNYLWLPPPTHVQAIFNPFVQAAPSAGEASDTPPQEQAATQPQIALPSLHRPESRPESEPQHHEAFMFLLSLLFLTARAASYLKSKEKAMHQIQAQLPG